MIAESLYRYYILSINCDLFLKYNHNSRPQMMYHHHRDCLEISSFIQIGKKGWGAYNDARVLNNNRLEILFMSFVAYYLYIYIYDIFIQVIIQYIRIQTYN